MSFVNVLGILVWLLACAISDWKTRRVPNVWVYGFGLVAALVLVLTRHALGGAGWQQGLLGFGMATLLTLPGFVLGRLGGGDVKLLMGLGLATDARTVAVTFVVATLALLVGAVWHRLKVGARDGLSREWPFVPCLLAGYVVTLAMGS